MQTSNVDYIYNAVYIICSIIFKWLRMAQAPVVILQLYISCCSFRSISYYMYKNDDMYFEIRLPMLTKVSKNWSTIKILSWIYQWLIELNVTIIFSAEMGNIVKAANQHALIVHFLFIYLKCVFKISPILLFFV